MWRSRWEESIGAQWSVNHRSLHERLFLLVQHSSYANPESSGTFPTEKAPHVLSCSTVRGRVSDITINLVSRGEGGGAGALHSLFTCKEMEISAGALYWCQRWPAAIWPLYSFWHPLLPTSFGLKLWHEVAACRVDRTESTMGWINVFKPAICFSLFLTT